MTASRPATMSTMAMLVVVATFTSVIFGCVIRFIQIPKNAQRTTRLNAMSFRNASIRMVRRVPIATIRIVQVKGAIPNPSHFTETRNAVTFAIVATVIQPRYTLNGTWTQSFSVMVTFDLPMLRRI